MFLCLFTLFEGILLKTVRAEENTIEYTNVLDDLKKDKTFNVNDYPAQANDYSLQVIQVAESENAELFVYVYQPSHATKDFVATSISLSTALGGDPEEIQNYTLSLLSTNGVFDKYKVNGITVGAEEIRYYFIVSIYRAYDNELDGVPPAGNTVSEKAYEVGQEWTVTSKNGDVVYQMEYEDVITVTDKYNGKIRYLDNFFFFNKSTESHYIAFNMDTPIVSLQEADVEFTYYTVYEETNSFATWNDRTITGAEQSKKVTLSKDEIFSKNGGVFTDTYEYKRIQSSSEFLKNESDSEHLREECIQNVQTKAWVLRFWETDYNTDFYYTTSADSILQNILTYESYTIVSDVSVLRLKFKFLGKTYNMGVVDNKASGSLIPDNEKPSVPDGGCNSSNLLELLLALVILSIGLFVLFLIWPFVKPIFMALFKVIWWILLFPFNLIGLLFKKKDK